MNLPPAGGTDLGLETFLKGQEDSGTSGPEAGLGICRPAFTFPGVLVLEQTQGRALRGLARTSGCAKKKKKKANENKTQSLASLSWRRMGNSGPWATEQEPWPLGPGCRDDPVGWGAPGPTLWGITTDLCPPKPNLRRAQGKNPLSRGYRNLAAPFMLVSV